MLMWRWLQKVPFVDPIERRLAPLLQLAIGAVALALAVAFVIAIVEDGFAALPWGVVVLAVLFWLALGSMMVLLRRGYFKLSMWLLLALLLAIAIRRLWFADASSAGDALVSFFLPLTVAGVFVSRRALIVTIVVICITVLLPGEYERIGDDIVLSFIFNLVLVGFLLDLLARTLRSELTAALDRNTELKMAYDALERSSSELYATNERLNITLQSIGDAVITTDAQARIILINDVAQQLTGWTQEEASGQPLVKVFNIINEYTRETVESPAERVLREGVIVGLANHTLLITKDGQEVPIDDSGAPIRDQDGGIVGVVLVFRDITERKEAETRERELIATAERQRLARDLHDSVTQSIFVATSRAEMVPRLWERDPDTAMTHLQEVININRGAMAEMRALLLELRPDALLNNTLPSLYQQLVDAAPARAEITGDLSVEGKERELPLQVHVALYRIVQESLNNTLKHSGASTFHIQLTYGADDVRIAVIDNGRGFDVNETPAGLGLKSIRERAEEIGAAVEITSNEGQGTTTNIYWKQ